MVGEVLLGLGDLRLERGQLRVPGVLVFVVIQGSGMAAPAGVASAMPSTRASALDSLQDMPCHDAPSYVPLRLWAIFLLKHTLSSSGWRLGQPDGAPAGGGRWGPFRVGQ